MVEVTYHCPYCGALTSLERDAYLRDKSVTEEPLPGWQYAGTTEDFEDSEVRRTSDSRTESGDADGVEMVCIADADDWEDGCGRVFYLNFVRFEEGEEGDPEGGWLEDEPNFDFLR
ncbi:hypothetical protein BRC81_08400 [Halobacteriales archaeon QS_1_68_20]|nr:MAG: hypothetical protein BRC81_08400 [Halobacteriales archaeon QS_1_68_20]